MYDGGGGGGLGMCGLRLTCCSAKHDEGEREIGGVEDGSEDAD